jgi:hypothetical protein
MQAQGAKANEYDAAFASRWCTRFKPRTVEANFQRDLLHSKKALDLHPERITVS